MCVQAWAAEDDDVWGSASIAHSLDAVRVYRHVYRHTHTGIDDVRVHRHVYTHAHTGLDDVLHVPMHMSAHISIRMSMHMFTQVVLATYARERSSTNTQICM